MYNPAHPGEILKELMIEPLGLSVTHTVQHLGVSRKTLSKVPNGRSAVTPEMAFGKPNASHTGSDYKMPMICGKPASSPCLFT